MSTTIILVRHGQTEWNRIERFRGRYDVPLNNVGLKQANKSAKFIGMRWKPAAIYTSPLSRAVQTAESIAKVCNLLVRPTSGIIDIDYGDWQGLTPDEVKKKWPELLSDWYERPETVQIPGGETLSKVRNRAMAVLREICLLHSDQEIVLVSHTVVNRLILLTTLGLGDDRFWHLGQEPCAINVIEKRGEEYIVQAMNCTSHLHKNS
ncbi:MAG: histidine phosphatase family protein [Anaerolineae bacterium]|nr:histidine phosphatase family protein [Anaerolineae bacterium]